MSWAMTDVQTVVWMTGEERRPDPLQADIDRFSAALDQAVGETADRGSRMQLADHVDVWARRPGTNRGLGVQSSTIASVPGVAIVGGRWPVDEHVKLARSGAIVMYRTVAISLGSKWANFRARRESAWPGLVDSIA